MKSITTTVMFLFFFSFAAFTQTGTTAPKTISVTGTASMEIIPDQIFISVELTEYEKRGQAKTELAAVKEEFINTCKAVGIPEKNISVDSYEGLSASIWRKFGGKKTVLNNTIRYVIEFNNVELIDKMMSKLNDDATVSIQIVKIGHTKMVEFLKEIRKQAIRAAKEKASYLCEAVSEKLGEAIEITEPETYAFSATRENRFLNSNISLGDKSEDFSVGFKKIPITYSIQARFRIL